MLIKEYRIPMPLSVEEYRIAQLYMIQKKSREESQGEGSGVEIIENRPYEDKDGGKGQYTRKIYHIGKHIPNWFAAILPKDALVVYEEAWNAYPYTRTRYTCPFIDKFSIDIETKYFDDAGDRDDAFNLVEKKYSRKSVAVDFIDIVCDQSGDLKKDEDPGVYHSEKTGRGPLTEDWLQQAMKNQGKPGNKVMCSYKLCKVEFKYWGMQSKIERFVQDVALRRTMVRAHRQAWCWQDEWVGLNMNDIRRLERETQAALEKKFGNESSESEDMLCEIVSNPVQTQKQNTSIHIKHNGTENAESMETATVESQSTHQVTTKKILVRQASSSSIWSNHSKASREGMAKLAPSLAEWRMHSIEQHSDHSSDEEFFDTSENLDRESLQKLEKHKWSSVDSLLDEEKREAFDKFNLTATVDPSVAYQISIEEDTLNQPLATGDSVDACKIQVLFLVIHGGPVEVADGAPNNSSKKDDLNTLCSAFDYIIMSHYKSSNHCFAFRLVSCPTICVEAYNMLRGLSPVGQDNSSSHPLSSALVTAYATFGPQYVETINTVLTKCNTIYHDFTMTPEGKGFNGQVCIITDSIGGIITYDILTSNWPTKSNSSSRRGSSLTPHEEEEDQGGSCTSLPSSPKLKFTYDHKENQPPGSPTLLKEPLTQDLDPLKLLNAGIKANRRYSANYCLDVQKNSNQQPQPSQNPATIPHRLSSSGSLDVVQKLDFDVSDVFALGSPLGVVLALRNSVYRTTDPVPRPACSRVYNIFYLADPSSSRLEPLLEPRFSRIPVIEIPRYNQFPLGDGRSYSLGDALSSNLDEFFDPLKLNRRASDWSVGSYGAGDNINTGTLNQSFDYANELPKSTKKTEELFDKVASRWFGDQRMDFALFCPESLSSFPSVSLPDLFYASFWESTDLAAFIIRQVVHQGNTGVGLDIDSNSSVPFTPSIQKEKWQRRRTQVKIRNMTSNHRAKDCIAIENGEQHITGRFTYGPLDVVNLTGEKIDVYINSMTPTQEWSHVVTEFTDSHGKLTCTIPTEKRLPVGKFPVKLVVRGDMTIADSYLTVVPQETDCVIFSIDGSFAASVSIMGSDPKVQPGSVDVVRHWQELGYLIIYVTARPDMQKNRVVTWLALHNFPHGPVWFADGISHDPLKQKTNFLKQILTDCNLNFVGGYGSNKDIAVYTQLGLTSQQIYIIGKTTKKQASQCQWLCDGYAQHLRELKMKLKPAKYNSQTVMRKGSFGLPGHRRRTQSKGKRGSSKRSDSILNS